MIDGPTMIDLITRKKAGGEMTLGELSWMCRAFTRGDIPDIQVAAWLMAVCWQGMTGRETGWLTEALISSGGTLEWSGDRPVVDKHSTGGVGDKTSIVLVPLVAAAGLTFVKMSGRGLGITGGTLDKLASIPGFRTELSLEEMRQQVGRIGCALVGQNPELVPADAAIYALRDITGTTDSLPLIASSVMSKKLAAGAHAIVLDVKYGAGAFMPDRAEAELLATAMVEIGAGAGRRVGAVLSPMDEPLGRAVGNALEVREAIETVRGRGPPDVRDLVLRLGAQLLVLAEVSPSVEDAGQELEWLLDSGAAAERLESLIDAQGGDARVVRDPSLLPAAASVIAVECEQDGWVERIDARGIAAAALMVRAGRARKGDAIDLAAGIRLTMKRGDRVQRGETVAEVHAGSWSEAAAAAARVRKAFEVRRVKSEE